MVQITVIPISEPNYWSGDKKQKRLWCHLINRSKIYEKVKSLTTFWMV